MSHHSRRGVLGLTAATGIGFLTSFGGGAQAQAACSSIPSTHDPNVIRIVYQVGLGLGVSDRVMLAGFEAGWVESHMNNLPCGDKDSLGVFQQRPSQGWGSPDQVLNVAFASNSFFSRAIVVAAVNPGWSAGRVAQGVQKSAFPDRYDQAQGKAQALIAEARQLQGPVPPPPPPQREGNQGGIAASWAIGRVDVFGRGGGGRVLHNFFQRGMEGGSFPGWSVLEGLSGMTCQPQVVSQYNGRLDVFGYDSNSKLRHWYFDRIGDNQWHGPEVIGSETTLRGTPAPVAYRPGRLDVFARDSSNRLRHNYFVHGGRSWGSWGALAGGQIVAGDPAVVMWHEARWDVFAVDTGGRMRHWYFDRLGDNQWHGPETIGTATFDPDSAPAAVSWTPGRIDVFARATDGRLLHNWADQPAADIWPAWQSLGGGIAAAPTAVSQYNGRLDVFAVGTDARIRQWYYDKLGDASWHGPGSMGTTTFTGVIDAIAWEPGRLDLFGIDTNQAMRHRWFQKSTGWSDGWQQLNGTFQTE